MKDSCQSESGNLNQKILIVDDLEDNLVFLKKILQTTHSEIFLAESGTEAIKQVAMHDFSVIILDVIMPEMDGYALAELLRQQPRSREVPLIFITGGHPEDKDLLRGYDIGATDYIIKPFAPEVLTRKVDILLGIEKKIHELEKERAELRIRESMRLEELAQSNQSLKQSRENALRMMEEAVQAKNLAEQSAARYRMLFKNMPSGFALHEMLYDDKGKAVDYRFLQVNPAFEKLTGLSAVSILGKTVKEVLPGTEPHWIELYAKVVESGDPGFFEEHSRELGKYFNVRAFRPAPSRFAVIFLDVTEIRKTAEHLKITQFSVDQLQDAVYWCEPGGKFTYVNEAACRELGYSKEELLSMDIWDVDPDVTPENWAIFIETIRRQNDWVMECTHRRKDRSTFRVEVKSRYLEMNGRILICSLAHNLTERKAKEAKIAASERLLRSIIDSIPIRIFWKDTKSVYLGGNIAFARDAGLTHADQLMGKTDHDLPWTADNASKYQADDLAVMESGAARLHLEDKQTWKDGTEHWFSTNKLPLTDAQGKVIGVLGTYEDITQRKNMQAAIEKRILALTQPLEDAREIAFEDLFNLEDIQKIQDAFAAATNVASIITTPKGIPITRPSNFTDMCLILRGTAIGCANCILSITEVGSADSGGPMVSICPTDCLREAGASITVGGKHVASWLVGQVRDESQSDEKILAYAREVGADEQKVLEAYRRIPVMSAETFQHVADALFTLANQLSHSAYQNIQQARFIADEKRRTQELRRLYAAIDQSPEVIVITDTDGAIEYVNPAFTSNTGYTEAEALGHNPSILKSGKQPDIFYQDMWKTLSAGNIWQGRLINKRKDGSLYTEDAIISPVKSAEGKITNYVAVKRDITNELHHEEQMQEAQKMEAVGQLAGGIAHDFNNILQTIMGFSDLLMLSLEHADDPAKRHVEEIQKAAQHAADLTRQLLAFSRKQHVNFTVVHLNDLITNSQGFLTSILGESVSLQLRLSPEIQSVHADVRQLERCLLNLTLNARDAMPKGGVLSIETRNVTLRKDQTLQHSEAKPGEYVCIRVADNGMGMDPEIVGRIFEPFFSTKGPTNGTGLGLSAVYGIIRKHQGWITVQSQPDQGAVFEIYLPAMLRQTGDPAAGTQNESDARLQGRGQRILVVEDAAAVRKLSVNTLNGAGFEVFSAKDAEEAEQIFTREQGHIDLLFSDVILPEENGAELAVSLRKRKPGLPVILCSGYSGNRIASLGVALEEYHFIEKPYSMGHLLNEVHRILSPED